MNLPAPISSTLPLANETISSLFLVKIKSEVHWKSPLSTLTVDNVNSIPEF